MEIEKLHFAELFKQENRAGKVLIETLLEIHGGCDNPQTDRNCHCEKCFFNAASTACGKLFLEYWLDKLKSGN